MYLTPSPTHFAHSLRLMFAVNLAHKAFACVATGHSRAVKSSLTDTSCLPLGLNAARAVAERTNGL
jgi:hypothetical protein